MVELGIVEAVQEVDRTRTGRRDADADLPRELRLAAGHETCHFLMPNLDEVDGSIQPRKSADQSANAVPRVAVDPANAPCMQTLPYEIGDGVGHGALLSGFQPSTSSALGGLHVSGSEQRPRQSRNLSNLILNEQSAPPPTPYLLPKVCSLVAGVA